MDIQIWPRVAAIVALILLSAYFSATETAFTSLNRIRIKNLSTGGDRKAKRVEALADDYDRLLSTILIGNNIVNITMAAVATVLFVELYGARGATISTIVITLLVLIFGEISPKSLAKEAPERWAMGTSGLTKAAVVLFTPFTFIFTKWKQLIVRLFKVDGGKNFTEEELLTIIEEAETEGTLDEERSELIQNAIEFNDLEAWDVLTPRVDVAAVDVETDKAEVADLFRSTGFSRLPVYEDDIDHILGVLNEKDFQHYLVGTDAPLRAYVKPVVFAPGTMKLPVLLKKMQNTKTHIAAVINEYGGVDGIVTMEDIIEELVGEIYDEHDTVISQDILQLPSGAYRVMAGTNLDKFFDFFGIDAQDSEAVTVNGWVARLLDKLPAVGDNFEAVYDKKILRGKVTKADTKKAVEILVHVENRE